MECNKVEASKAKVIAEQKFRENDFAGAKKFALKAQALYPGTEGLSQLMMTINVYVSAEKKISSSIGGVEVDWYEVLGVTPTADDETIKKQYRKLALMIHPDKNNCVGADGAFKLVSEALNLLSDKAKRYAYDQRIGFLKNTGNVFTNIYNNRSSPSSFWNVIPTLPFLTPQPPSPPQTLPFLTPQQPPPLINTFVTHCPKCMTRQEFPWKYKGYNVECSHCLRPFQAVLAEFKLSNLFPELYNDVQRRQHYITPLYFPSNNNNNNSFPHHQNSNHVPPPTTTTTTCANVCNPSAPNTGELGVGGANQFFSHDNVSFGSRMAASVGPTESVTKDAANVVAQQQQKANNSFERMKRALREEEEENAQGGGWERRVKTCTR